LKGIELKSLTISQPFASLIADGSKFTENRKWLTSYRGPLAIHAGKGTQYLTKSELAGYPHGCIVAIANLVACIRLEDILDSEPLRIIAGSRYTVGDIVSHKHAEGPYCWVLDDVVKLNEPVPCNGAQGLWGVDAQVARSVQAAKQ
jgi:activating signal cointegrator 1